MLAPPVTAVVIMLDETINPGGKPTADELLKRKSWTESIKVPQ